MKDSYQIAPWVDLQKNEEETLLKSFKSFKIKNTSEPINHNIPQTASQTRIPRVAMISKGFQEKSKKSIQSMKENKPISLSELKLRPINTQLRVKSIGKFNLLYSLKKQQMSKIDSYPLIKKTLETSHACSRIKHIMEAKNKRDKMNLKNLEPKKQYIKNNNIIPTTSRMEIKFEGWKMQSKSTSNHQKKKVSFGSKSKKDHFLDKFLDRFIS